MKDFFRPKGEKKLELKLRWNVQKWAQNVEKASRRRDFFWFLTIMENSPLFQADKNAPQNAPKRSKNGLKTLKKPAAGGKFFGVLGIFRNKPPLL